MKIYNKADFLKLPKGTLFCKCAYPWIFDNLKVKGNSLANISDFQQRDICWIDGDGNKTALSFLDEMLMHGTSGRIETAYGRDGTLNEDDMFLVYEEQDLLDLKGIVEEAMDIADLHNQ